MMKSISAFVWDVISNDVKTLSTETLRTSTHCFLANNIHLIPKWKWLMNINVRRPCIHYLLGATPTSTPGALCNTGYPSETHTELISRENSCVHNTRFRCIIVLQFCTEHGSITAMICAKSRFGNCDVSGQTRFEVKISFGRISQIAQGPWAGGYSVKSMLNSMLVYKDFLTWLLIGWGCAASQSDARFENLW